MIGISDLFYNNNELELGLAANQLAFIFAENNEHATDREKQSILHNTGCLCNIMLQKVKNDNDQEKSKEYTLKAEESFQKALSYSNEGSNNSVLYIEYANFLIGQKEFTKAFEYLKQAIQSHDKTSGLQYGARDKEVVAAILKQSIEASDKKEIALNVQEYAYYLLIANYNNFISSGINEIEDKSEYLEQFIQYDMDRDSNMSYTSCLLLANACYSCDRVADATMFAFAPVIYQMYQLENQHDFNHL